MNIATTHKQSSRIIECGVNKETADMMYSGQGTLSAIPFCKELYDIAYFPAWSLSALMTLLPSTILSECGKEYHLELSRVRMHSQWEVQWFDGMVRFSTRDKYTKEFIPLWGPSPIEACVKAIEWLTSNGYKLNDRI